MRFEYKVVQSTQDMASLESAWKELEHGVEMTVFQSYDWNMLLIEQWMKFRDNGLVLCHNDTYEPNYLYDKDGKIYLIDWEYAGLNYAANDIGCILCRYDWTEAQIERYLKAYVGHELSKDEHRYYMAFIPISAFYWFCWGLYKGSVGDDDSFFFLPAYRNLTRFIDQALESYQ